MLIPCPECGHQVSTLAVVCPGCGAAVRAADPVPVADHGGSFLHRSRGFGDLVLYGCAGFVLFVVVLLLLGLMA